MTAEGIELRNKLIKYNIEVLRPEIEKILKQKIETMENPRIQDEEEQIKDFLLEFSGECKELVTNETLKIQQQVLRRMLDNLL